MDVGSETKSERTEPEDVKKLIDFTTALDIPEDGGSIFKKVLNRMRKRKSISPTTKSRLQPISIRQLYQYANWLDCTYLIVGTILAFIIGALQPTVTLLGGILENILIKSTEPVGDTQFRTDAYKVVYWYVVAGVVVSILSLAQVILTQRGCSGIVSRLRIAFLDSVLHQDAIWLDNNDAGALAANLGEHIEKVREGLGEKWGLVIRGVSMFMASVGISLAYDWRTTLIMFGLVPASAITMYFSAKVSEKPALRQMDISGAADSVAEESISAWKTVAACNAQEFFVKKYAKMLSLGTKWAMKVNFLNGFLEGIMFIEMYFFMAGGFLYGTMAYYSGSVTEPGHVFVVVNTMVFGGYFVSVLSPHLHSLSRARMAAARICEIAERTPPNVSKSGKQLPELSGKIEFKDVTFEYAERRDRILDEISFTIESGQNVAFVGASGCGKSTAFSLLAGVYEPNSGRIFADGHDLTTLDITSLRKHLGIVSQEPPLFSGTISENIAMGREVTRNDIIEAAKIAAAHHFIEKLDEGYDTLVGHGGVSLSGGQKQRIGIARAIIGKPKILLLDEATSALDTQSEAYVQKALEATKANRTTISIAHRLSTTRNSDVIFVFDKGRIVEKGTHIELLALDGLYAGLARAQKLTGANDGNKTKKTFKSVAKACTNLIHVSKMFTAEKPEDQAREKSPECPSLLVRNTPEDGAMRASFRNHFGRMMSPSVVSDLAASFGQEIKMKDHQKSWAFLLRFYKNTLATNGVGIIGSQLISVLRGFELPSYCYLQKVVFDQLQAGPDDYQKYLILSTSLFAVLGFWCLLTITGANVLSARVADACVNALREKVLAKTLLRDGRYFDKEETSASACIGTLSQQPESCKAALDARSNVFTSNFTGLVICLSLTFIFCWEMGILSVCVCIVLMIGLFGFTYAVERKMKHRIIADTTSQLALEAITHTRQIQLLSSENFFLGRYERKQQEVAKLDFLVAVFQAATQALTQGFVFFCEAAAFALGIWLVFEGKRTASDIFMGAMCVSFAGWALFFMQPSFNDLSRATAAASSLYALLEGSATDLDEGLQTDLDGSVEAIDLQFAYPSRPEYKVATGLSIKAAPEETIALVGESGCGKSTIIQLIERFYSPHAGTLKIGGHQADLVSLRKLRNHVALVGQEPVLFKGTIRENITLGVEDVTLEEVMKAANEAHCASFIEAFPSGYETELGERGKGLSGGQKQRIAIARALIRKPKILLLDEATSALDTQSEQIVQEALAKVSAARTTISIAHRLSTIQNCDRIYYIEHGKVQDAGSHAELLQKNEKYAKMVQMQTLTR